MSGVFNPARNWSEHKTAIEQVRLSSPVPVGAVGVFGEGFEEAEDISRRCDCWLGDYIEEQSGSVIKDRDDDNPRVWSRGDTDYGVNLMECNTAIEQVRLLSSEEDLNADANIAYCPLGGADGVAGTGSEEAVKTGRRQ